MLLQKGATPLWVGLNADNWQYLAVVDVKVFTKDKRIEGTVDWPYKVHGFSEKAAKRTFLLPSQNSWTLCYETLMICKRKVGRIFTTQNKNCVHFYLAACTQSKLPNQVGCLNFGWSVYSSSTLFFLGFHHGDTCVFPHFLLPTRILIEKLFFLAKR